MGGAAWHSHPCPFATQAGEEVNTPRPKWGVAIYVLWAVVACGLLALFTSAKSAFGQTTDNGLESGAKALLIEASIVAEAIVLMRRVAPGWGQWAKFILAMLGMGVSITVSITYNYVQAQAHGAITDTWQLLTLSVGPVASMATLGLLLGYLLAEYESEVKKYENEVAGAKETNQIRANMNATNTAEGERMRQWNKAEAESERKASAEEADKERAHKERMAKIAAGIDPDAPPQAPQAPVGKVAQASPELAALVAEFRTSNATSKSTSGDLCRYLHGLGYSNTEIATATGVHISGVGKHINRSNTGRA